MANVLRISNAVSLALHAMVYLAKQPGRLIPTHEIADVYGVSQNHLAKVCQRLEKAGLIRGTRGPNGGFQLAEPPGEITLLDIHEAIDGPFRLTDCLLQTPVCDENRCILNDLVKNVNEQVLRHFSQTTLADLSNSES